MRTMISLNAILPAPRISAFEEGKHWILPDQNITIALHCPQTWLHRVIHAANSLLRAFPHLEDDHLSWRLDHTRKDAPPLPGEFTMRIVPALEDRLGFEGYHLRVADGAVVEAAGPEGLFYGIQTLVQLLQKEDSGFQFPHCDILDWPAWGWRGFLLDTGRNFMGLEFLKHQIEAGARYKLNTFHLHLSDYPGWRFQTRAFPQLATSPFYTQDDLRRLVDYASSRSVNIVPEIDMPGHCTVFLDAMPHLKCNNDTMCAGREEVYETLEVILSELAEVFPGPYIHIGTDECEPGEGCPNCRAKLEELGASKDDRLPLMSYFIGRVNQMVNRLGRTAICWNDQVQAGLPENLIIQSWLPGSDAPGIAESGWRVINSRAPEVYFDHGTTDGFIPRIWEWSPCEGQTDISPLLIGGEGEAWHDPPADEQTILQDLGFYPRLLTLAERLWTGVEGKSRGFTEFQARLLEHKERYFTGLPFPYPGQVDDWKARYEGWTTNRGIWVQK